jgi:hypothetical protein
VWRWRKALAVTRAGNEGTRRLLRATTEAVAANLRGKNLPAVQV